MARAGTTWRMRFEDWIVEGWSGEAWHVEAVTDRLGEARLATAWTGMTWPCSVEAVVV